MSKGGVLNLNFPEVDNLMTAIQNYPGNAERVINDTLHGFAGQKAQEAIYRLMPISDKKKGKHAAKAKSLSNVNGNLSVTVTAKGKWHYLYFPDDGTNTRRHVGNQRFFERGGESAIGEIVDRCINNLVTKFDEGV